jgi:hypothetical protein
MPIGDFPLRWRQRAPHFRGTPQGLRDVAPWPPPPRQTVQSDCGPRLRAPLDLSKGESALYALLHRMAIWWRAAALVALVALAAGLGQTAIGHQVLRKTGLFEEQAGYTSLAFQDPGFLVEQLSSERESVDVSFVIHNATSTPRSYLWSEFVAQGGRSRRVAAGAVRVAAERETAITRLQELSCTRGRVQVIVKLASPAESIDAWMACSSPRRPTLPHRHASGSRRVR